MTNQCICTPLFLILKISLSSVFFSLGMFLRNRSSNLRRRWSAISAGSGTSKANSSIGPVANSVSGTTSSSGSDGSVKLHLGMQVLLISANEMGIIRYIGTADFAHGLWLGLELRSPKGRNDGCVGIRRYFSCRPGHGVLVRPSRVTYRGISGAKLVDECCWDPHTHTRIICFIFNFVFMNFYELFSQSKEYYLGLTYWNFLDIHIWNFLKSSYQIFLPTWFYILARHENSNRVKSRQ